jgi:hypothetical protein
LIPTVLIALDFIYVTWNSGTMMIDCTHYIATLMWVTGNAIWAFGEIFFPDISDETQPIFTSSSVTRNDFRWWASWALFAAYIPIWLLYFVWLPLTCMGKIKASDLPENSNFGTASFSFTVTHDQITGLGGHNNSSNSNNSNAASVGSSINPVGGSVATVTQASGQV